MVISSELLLYRRDEHGPAEIAVAQVQFRNKCVFVALLLSAGYDPDQEPALLQELEDALYLVCIPRHCGIMRINSAVAAAVTLLQDFDGCEQSEARRIVCRTRETALHVLALLRLRVMPVGMQL